MREDVLSLLERLVEMGHRCTLVSAPSSLQLSSLR